MIPDKGYITGVTRALANPQAVEQFSRRYYGMRRSTSDVPPGEGGFQRQIGAAVDRFFYFVAMVRGQ